jgi:hypothetical protein
VLQLYEAHGLKENLYFAQEMLLMLDDAGFRNVVIEAYPAGRPATADDGTVAFVATKLERSKATISSLHGCQKGVRGFKR